VRQEERERCAKIAEEIYSDAAISADYRNAARSIVHAIRKGEPT
jgi:hypothetical protein